MSDDQSGEGEKVEKVFLPPGNGSRQHNLKMGQRGKEDRKQKIRRHVRDQI